MRRYHGFRFSAALLIFSFMLIGLPMAAACLDETTEKQDDASPKEDAADDTPVEEKSTDSSTASINLELKVNGSNAVFVAERDFSKGLSEAANLKKKAKLATKPLREVQQEITTLEGRMLQAEQQMIGLNVQLANVNDVASNNRLVGAINTLEGQITLAKKTLETLKTNETTARAELNNAREAFVQQVLNLKDVSQQLDEAYESSETNADIQASLKKLRDESGKELTLQPSSAMQSLQRKLSELSDSIQTEKITLRRDGNTFLASVVINGKHTAEMVVDTGASLIMIPFEMAASMGMKPEGGDKQILLVMADGRTIVGYLKMLDSVRVGTFSTEKVPCAVLGPEATSAEPLLGMSFLGEFQFNLDAAEGTLGMTQIESDTTSGSRRK